MNHCVRSASNFTDSGDGPTQIAFAAVFAGVFASSQLSTDSTARSARLMIDRVFEFPCASTTFSAGDMVTVTYSAGLVDQSVTKTTDPLKCIGKVLKEYTSATTKVKVRLTSKSLTNFWASGSGSIGATDITGTDSSLAITGEAGASGVGGTVLVTGGAGDGAAGGPVTVTGGAGGAASTGGAVSMTGGAPVSGNGTGGAASLVGGAGSGTGTGGAVAVTGGASGAGATGNGGAITGAGGAAASTNGTGGAVSWTGGAATGTGVGGAVSLVGGLGGATNAVGGAASVTAGAGQGTGNGAVAAVTGGASGAGATGTGGVAKLVGGAAASTNGTGGAAQVTGGVATGTGTGGAVTITGGASAGGTGTAGSVTIDAGAATGGTAGTVKIGSTNAASVKIGTTVSTENAAIKGIYYSGTIAVTVPSITDPDEAHVDVDVSAMTFAPAVGDAVIAIPLVALPTNCNILGAQVSATDQVTITYGSEGGNVTGAAKNHGFLFIDLT